MGSLNFDQPIERRGTDSLKWSRYGEHDILPLWVADMDFAAPPAVITAIEKRVAHGVFGYAAPWPSLTGAVLDHLLRHYDWAVDAEWLVWLPGLVTGLNVACRAVDGDVVTATPVYPPFLSAPRYSGKKLASAPLKQENGVWRWDFTALENALTPTTRLLLLCHPHNPVGRAWDVDELGELASFCKRHELIVCSDEIHCGLVLDADRVHLPLAKLDSDIARRSITLMAPSKTYNVPGLGCAFAVIPDATLRQNFHHAMAGIVPHINVLGLVACEAAYRDSDDWHGALTDYLRDNCTRLEAAVAAMPGLTMSHVEATYLAWIDARGLGVSDPADLFEKAGVGLSNGADFGLPGWVRLNFGCRRETLDLAVARMHQACLGATAGGAALLE